MQGVLFRDQQGIERLFIRQTHSYQTNQRLTHLSSGLFILILLGYICGNSHRSWGLFLTWCVIIAYRLLRGRTMNVEAMRTTFDKTVAALIGQGILLSRIGVELHIVGKDRCIIQSRMKNSRRGYSRSIRVGILISLSA